MVEVLLVMPTEAKPQGLRIRALQRMGANDQTNIICPILATLVFPLWLLQSNERSVPFREHPLPQLKMRSVLCGY